MTLTLAEKEHLTDNIWAFRFKLGVALGWTAGQFVRVELRHDNPDKEGTKRWFTNSAAPYEGIVQITTRITNTTFKQALSKLEIGAKIQLIEDPDGDFVWERAEMPIVFVAGGIGITPFYSILKQRVYEGQGLNLTLVYGSRTADVPFKAELEQWAAANDGFRLIYAVDMELNAKNLADQIPNINSSLVYVSGPEPMVEALGKNLKRHGLPKEQLKQDFFPNYDESNY